MMLSSNDSKEVARLLQRPRVISLQIERSGDQEFEQVLARRSASELFPGARSPEAALAGLWLYGGFWSKSHQVAQDIESREGSYWHAMLHRIEQDFGNAMYWFRRVGAHPIEPALALAVNRWRQEISVSDWPETVSTWDHANWVRFVAAVRPGSAEERFALAVQQEEWKLLFEYCVSPAAAASQRSSS